MDICIEISRFFFLLLALYIFVRVVDHSIAELSFRKHMRQSGPGHWFGDLTVVRAEQKELLGARYGLKWENSIGSSRSCDITIAHPGMAKSHAVLYLTKDSVFIAPTGRSRVLVNGKTVHKKEEVYEGDTLSFGTLALRVHLEEGEVEA